MTEGINKAKGPLSFLAISVAWDLSIVFIALQQGIADGRADDLGVIIFWSAIFVTIAWLIFILLPLRWLNHSSKIFSYPIFPIFTGIYAVIVFTILIGWLFLKSDFKVVFWIAFLIGVLFGSIYLALIRSSRIVKKMQESWFMRTSVILYPTIFMVLYLKVFPTLFPAYAFRFMPDDIRREIIKETIPKFKVGDDFYELERALPGYFEHFENGSGNTAAQLEDFTFVVQANCYKIIRLKYSYNRDEVFAIYGNLHDDNPCP